MARRAFFLPVSGRPGVSAGLPPAAVSVVPRNECQRVRKMVIGSMGWHRLSPQQCSCRLRLSFYVLLAYAP